MDAVKPYTRVWRYSFSIICLLESPNYKKSESLVRSQVSTQGNFLFPLSPNAELETLILPFPRGYWLPTLEEALIFSASVSVHVSARFPRNCWPKTADFIQFSCYLSLLWRRRRRAQLSARSHLFSVCFFSQPVWTHIHFPGMGIIQINHYRVIVVCQQRAWRCDRRTSHESFLYPLFIICDSNQLWSSTSSSKRWNILLPFAPIRLHVSWSMREVLCCVHCLVWKIMHPHGAHCKLNSINYIQNTLASDAEI